MFNEWGLREVSRTLKQLVVNITSADGEARGISWFVYVDAVEGAVEGAVVCRAEC